jgi:hypothetical protein
MHRPHPPDIGEFVVAGSKRLAKLHLLLFILLFGFSGVLFAQTAATGALRGTVTDPSGSVVPGVTVKVTSNETGQTRTAVTQNNGTYLVPLLPLGAYRLETAAKVSSQRHSSTSAFTSPKPRYWTFICRWAASLRS